MNVRAPLLPTSRALLRVCHQSFRTPLQQQTSRLITAHSRLHSLPHRTSYRDLGRMVTTIPYLNLFDDFRSLALPSVEST